MVPINLSISKRVLENFLARSVKDQDNSDCTDHMVCHLVGNRTEGPNNYTSYRIFQLIKQLKR